MFALASICKKFASNPCVVKTHHLKEKIYSFYQALLEIKTNGVLNSNFANRYLVLYHKVEC